MYFKAKQNGPFKMFFYFWTFYPLVIDLIQKSGKKCHGTTMIYNPMGAVTHFKRLYEKSEKKKYFFYKCIS